MFGSHKNCPIFCVLLPSSTITHPPQHLTAPEMPKPGRRGSSGRLSKHYQTLGSV
ncbi:hypothetical protein BKA93DRAFT_797180 [Sparassis latifolia]